MLTLGSLSFAAPLALLALAALPLLWWLLRLLPPAPRRVPFPPLSLMLNLAGHEEAAARTPWWLLLLRLALASLLILGAARPLLNATAAPLTRGGPMVIVVDDGWAAAVDWEERRRTLLRLIDAAERADRPLWLIGTAPAGDEPLPTPLSAARARDVAHAWLPKPWPGDRPAALDRLAAALGERGAAVSWLADGLASADAAADRAFVDRLRGFGPLTVHLPEAASLPLLLRPGKAEEGAGLALELSRPRAGSERLATLRFLAEDGAALANETARFDADARRLVIQPALPGDWLARLARVDVADEATAGAVALLDDRWRLKPVGLVAEGAATQEPLLDQGYYLEKALAPFAEVRRGAVAALLARPLAVMVIADGEFADVGDRDRVRQWVEAGGVLLRFAGPRLARANTSDDPLLPVALRPGARALGGNLSWGTRGRLAPFDPRGPFDGLAVPPDLEVRQQVMAEPTLDLDARTWARLDDGTPLITGQRQGKGWLVLVHTTANAEWANVALSGVFIDLLRRIVDLAGGVAAHAGEGPPLAPIATLDGFGRLGEPPAGARAIAARDFATALPGANHPPGLYGAGGGKRALNLGPAVPTLAPLPELPNGVVVERYRDAGETELRGALWALALGLFLLDLALSAALSGVFRARARGAATAGVLLALMATLAPAARAAPDQTTIADGTAVAASLAPRLAYIVTGDRERDAISRAGLRGLTAVVNRRTAVELAEPVGVDPARDDLVFYPFVYWSVAGNPSLPPTARTRLGHYLRNGGTVVFDTRGAGRGEGGDLRQLAEQLALPPLVAVPDDHVLRRAYYLLGEIPGRTGVGTVWIEPVGERVNDGVTSVVAGGGDWAGAWAVDDGLRPLLPVTPGGERQRELAYRFGVNLVMHVLTGNYKADQVHLPAILERLTQ